MKTKTLAAMVKQEVSRLGYKHVSISVKKDGLVVVDNLGTYMETTQTLLTRLGIQATYMTPSMSRVNP